MDRCQAHSLDALGTARKHAPSAPPTHTHTSTWLSFLVAQWKHFSKEHLCCPLGAQTKEVFFVCVCFAIARPFLPADVGVSPVGAASCCRLERSSVILWGGFRVGRLSKAAADCNPWDGLIWPVRERPVAIFQVGVGWRGGVGVREALEDGN